MTTSSINTSNKLLQQLIDFVWRQWTSLGVPGNRASEGDWIIDPEALLLITTEIGRYDSRLLDSAIDWLLVNGQSINLQRLQRLHGQWGPCDERVLSAIAEILAEKSTLRKWRTLQEKYHTSETREPLFLNPDGSPMPVIGTPDPRFAKYGLLRSPWSPRSHSQAPNPKRSANLLLTLRSLFGVNARAEIMAWLLTHEEGHPAAIAKDTAYFSKSIQVTINEMEASGQLRSQRHGREKHFRLHHDDWKFLITDQSDASFPRWITWPPVFHFCFHTIELLSKSPPTGSESLRSIQMRGFLDDVAPALRESRLHLRMNANPTSTGDSLTQAILDDVEQLGRLLENDFREDSARK